MTELRTRVGAALLAGLVLALLPTVSRAEDAPAAPPAAPAAAAASGIAWQADLKAAGAAAREQKRNLLIHVAAAGCGACAKMESATFADPGVVAYVAENLVAVRLDTQKDAKMVSALGILWTPTYLVMQFEPTGGTSLLRVFTGFRPPDDFLGELKAGADGHRRIAELKTADPKDALLQAELGDLYWAEGKAPLAKAAYAAAAAADPKNEKGKTLAALYGVARVLILEGDGAALRETVKQLVTLDPKDEKSYVAKLALDGTHHLMNSAKEFKAAGEKYLEVAKQYEKTDVAAEALYWAGAARALAGDSAGFEAAWNRLVTEHPESAWARRSAWVKK